MKFSCNRASILDAITNAGKAVSSKSTIATLEGVLLKTINGKLEVTGYDLEIGIITTLDCDIYTEGNIILNARLFSDIIRKLNDDTVYVEVDESLNTTITCGDATFTISGIDGSEYPEIPTVSEEYSFTVAGDILKSMIRQTIFSVAQVFVNKVYTGSLFELDGKTFKIVTMDGNRLSIREEQINNDLQLSFIVPAKTQSEICRMISDDEDTEIKISVGEKHVIFNIGDYKVVSRLLEGEFLNYKKTIPSDFNTTVRINTKDLLSAVDRASLLISERLRSPVRCLFKEDNIKISCNSPLGNFVDKCAASLNGEEVEIGFNNKFLLDALKATESDEVLFELKGAIFPMIVKPVEGNSFLFLVAPVRLKG